MKTPLNRTNNFIVFTNEIKTNNSVTESKLVIGGQRGKTYPRIESMSVANTCYHSSSNKSGNRNAY